MGEKWKNIQQCTFLPFLLSSSFSSPGKYPSPAPSELDCCCCCCCCLLCTDCRTRCQTAETCDSSMFYQNWLIVSTMIAKHIEHLSQQCFIGRNFVSTKFVKQLKHVNRQCFIRSEVVSTMIAFSPPANTGKLRRGTDMVVFEGQTSIDFLHGILDCYHKFTKEVIRSDLGHHHCRHYRHHHYYRHFHQNHCNHVWSNIVLPPLVPKDVMTSVKNVSKRGEVAAK